MNDYERLLCQVQKEVPVLEVALDQYDSEGFYRNGKIFIEKSLSVKRKREILAEEYAHYKTSVGTIVNIKDIQNSKQEYIARNYSYDLLISLDDLISCSKEGFSSSFECAEYLGVSQDTLDQVLQYYQQKYGTIYLYKDKIINFYGNRMSVIDTQLCGN